MEMGESEDNRRTKKERKMGPRINKRYPGRQTSRWKDPEDAGIQWMAKATMRNEWLTIGEASIQK